MNQNRRNSSLVAEESGIALVVTVLLLLLVSAIGVSALNRAGDEKIISTASRKQVSNLAAADAGLRMVRARLENVAGSAAAGNQVFTLDDSVTFVDPYSQLPTRVRTGTIADGLQPIQKLQTRIQDGDELGIGGGGASMRRQVYRVNITATDPSGGNTQVEAQFSVTVPNS